VDFKFDSFPAPVVAFSAPDDKAHGKLHNQYAFNNATINGVRGVHSIEHYFQAMKHIPPGGYSKTSDDEKIYVKRILEYGRKGEPLSELPAFARKQQQEIFGRKLDLNEWRKNWGTVSLRVMREGIRARLNRDGELNETLLDMPPNTVIVVAAPPHSSDNPERSLKWTDGEDGSGENLLGVIYMEELLRRQHIRQYGSLNEEAERKIEQEVKQKNDAFKQYRQNHFLGAAIRFPVRDRAYAGGDAPQVLLQNVAERPFATIMSKGSSPNASVLAKTPARLYNIKDVHNLVLNRQILYQQMQKDQEMQKQVQRNRQTAKAHYDPNAFQNPDEVKRSLRIKRDVNETDDKAGEHCSVWRHKSKHRTITSNVTCYANGFGEPLKTPLQLVITSGCAPNFTTSTKDEEFFLDSKRVDGNAEFKNNGREYKAFMETLFLRMLRDQAERGVQVVVLPEIGGGLYLGCLSDNGRAEASKLYNEALKNVLAKHSFPPIEEIIRPLPDIKAKDAKNEARSAAFLKATEEFSTFNGSPRVTIANTDALEAAIIATREGKKAGIINPGSDRTIGGNYYNTGTGRHSESTTLEEVLCNVTDLALVQSSSFNPDISCIPYPQLLEKKSETTPTGSRVEDDKHKGHIKFTSAENIRSIKTLLDKYAGSISEKSTAPSTAHRTTLWTRVVNLAEKAPDAPIIFKKGDSEFSIYPQKLETQKDDDESFFAMLVAFRASNEPSRTPHISTYPEAQEKWKKALDRATEEKLFSPEQMAEIAKLEIIHSKPAPAPRVPAVTVSPLEPPHEAHDEPVRKTPGSPRSNHG
jgi:predicted NAD-dependent protein-ADP-ribosyltransferase YbiA (DUF1768 family)